MTLDITTRRGWGADRGRTGSTLGKVDHVIVHHFYIPDVAASASRTQEASAMRGVEDYHANLGWSAAPGYPWVVFDSGRVYEGVGWGRRGVHTVGYNSSAVAVCFANNGDKEAATSKAWQAAHEIVEQGVARGLIARNYRLTGHRDHAAKSCPGNKTYPHLSRVRTGMDVPQEDDDMLRKGDNSDHVAELQDALNHAVKHGPWGIKPGWHPLDADGDYGPKTARAVGQLKGLVYYRGDGNDAHPNFVARMEAYSRQHVHTDGA